MIHITKNYTINHFHYQQLVPLSKQTVKFHYQQLVSVTKQIVKLTVMEWCKSKMQIVVIDGLSMRNIRYID